MKENLAEIIIIHDNSLLSNYTKAEINKCYNDFFKHLKRDDKEINITLFTYANKGNIVMENKQIEKIKLKEINDNTKGARPVLDVIAKAINDIGMRYAGTSSDLHPSNIFFIPFVFDKDNASKVYTFSDVEKMILHQAEYYSWMFYLVNAVSSYNEKFSYLNTISVDTYDDNYFEYALGELAKKIHEQFDKNN